VASIGLAFIIAFYFVRITAKSKGLVRNGVTSVFFCIVIYLSIYSNLRCHEWKDSESIKKDLRELLKQRDDYVPKELEKIMKEEIGGKK